MVDRTLSAQHLVLAEPPFSTLQGEGRYMGEPTTFVRLAGCNLSCDFCDTDYTPKVRTTVDELLAQLAAFPDRAVVVTGGEPLIHRQLIELARGLVRGGRAITIETNGTMRDARLDPYVRLYSLSPKLETSGNSDGIRPEVLKSYLELPGTRWQLKFVICTEDDFEQVAMLLFDLGVPWGSEVYFQPEYQSVSFGEMLAWFRGHQSAFEHWVPRLLPQMHKLVNLP